MRKIILRENCIPTILLLGAFVLLTSCAHGIDGAKQFVTNSALVLVNAQETLTRIDQERQKVIQAEAASDKAKAQKDLDEHLQKYNLAHNVLKTATTALKDLSEALTAGRDYTALTASLVKAMGDVPVVLAQWGVIK